MATPKNMKAWRYSTASGGLEKNLEPVDDVPLPPHDDLGPNDALVRVHAMSVNPVDFKMVEMPLVGGRMVKMPATPGKDFAGIIAQLSPEGSSRGLQEGMRVFGRLEGQPRYGALGEYIIISAGDACVELPEGVSFEDGASVGTAGMAALQSIKPYLPKSGGAVFINGGTAGTGTFGLQFARALGAEKIVTTCSGPNEQMVKDLGATGVIDYRSMNILEALKSYGPIFDICIDFIGTPSKLYQASQTFLKPEGQFVQISATPDAAGISALMRAQYQPAWLGGGNMKYAFLRSQNVAEDFELVGKWMSEGKVKAVTDSVFEWQDAKKAYEVLKGGRAKGKIVVRGPE